MTYRKSIADKQREAGYKEDGVGGEHRQARYQNNPRNEPVGHYTGRCSRCGSDNLWDDNLHYGCNSCGAVLG